MTAVFTVIICFGAILGAAAGFFKKFTKSSFWGITACLTLLLEMAVGAAVKKSSNGFGAAVIITTAVCLIVFSAVLLALQKLLAKAVEARRKLSHYKNFDDRDENEQLILSALDSGDRGQYRRLMRKRRRIKDSAGLWGLLDGVFGAVNGCVNMITGLGAVCVCIVLFVDLTQISFLTGAFTKVLASGMWAGTGAKIALDLPIVCLLCAALHVGYNSGISSVLCFLAIIGMLVGFGFASWAIASSAACNSAVAGLQSGVLSDLTGTLGEGATATVARVIIAAIIFLFALVIVVIVGVLLPKLTERLRENAVYSAVDGVVGAIVLLAFIAMIMIALGGIAYTLHDIAFMERFNRIAGFAQLGDAMYACNPMASVWAQVPLRGLFGNT